MVALLENSENQVREFSRYSRRTVSGLEEAEECRALVQYAIKTIEYVLNTDLQLRDAALAGEFVFTDEEENRIRAIVAQWAERVPNVLKWAEQVKSAGHRVQDTSQLADYLEVAKGIASYRSDSASPDWVADQAEKALEEHRRGETAEWLSE